MKTVRNLLYRDVLWSVFFVTIFFIALFFFIDFVDEMSRVGRNGSLLEVEEGFKLLASLMQHDRRREKARRAGSVQIGIG